MTSPPKGCWALSVEATASGRAGADVEQRADHRRGAEVEGDGVARGRGVAGLDVDEGLVDDDRGDLEVGLAQHGRQPPQHVEVGGELEVVDRVGEADEVGALVGERGLVELDVALLEGRAQDHLTPDPDGRGLGPGGQRGHLDGEVARRVEQAAEPPPLGELGRGEGAHVVAGDRGRVAGGDPDPALVAGAVAAAGGVDRDAVPRRGVEDGHPGRHPHVALRRRDLHAALGLAADREREADAARAVVGGGLDPGPLDEALAGHVGEREVGPVGGGHGLPAGAAVLPASRGGR